MKYPEPRGAVCKKCKKNLCEYYCFCIRSKDALCCWEPNDSDSDIGSATVSEMRKQNGDY